MQRLSLSSAGARRNPDIHMLEGGPRRVLAKFESLKDENEIAPSHYAYLYDRVAVNEDRAQKFAGALPLNESSLPVRPGVSDPVQAPASSSVKTLFERLEVRVHRGQLGGAVRGVGFQHLDPLSQRNQKPV